ncbi:MAG: acyl-CoA carboxylase subunit epsilon, partial [Nocardioidaceae bacterium]|nr:acyl-CoA carboxylase subunit epsilon [Nocardioidaceae bacterium]
MPQQAPLLRVVRGDPTADELAALVAIVVARRAAAAVVSPAIRRSGWSERNRLLRVT